MRYNTSWQILDEDDLYQEACEWLIRLLWDWDEEKEVGLVKYVLWNIGARLQNEIIYEKRKRRHPIKAKKLIITTNVDQNQINQNEISEETIPSKNNDSPESIAIVREALEKAEEKLDNESKEILFRLIQNNGNLSSVTRDILLNSDSRNRFGDTTNQVYYKVREKIFPKISKIFNPNEII
jgi:hypothetical protein